MKKIRKILTALAALVSTAGMMLVPVTAHAFSLPEAGSFGYDVYEIVIIKMLGGPIGWVGAGILLVWGISQIMKQWIITVMCVVGATAIVKVTTILQSLGAVIH